MSTAYEEVGRVRQKQRTRDALVRAARALVAEGDTPTVEEAAEQAGVSRTTAYRYFPSQAALLAEAHPHIAMTTLLPDDPPESVEERLEIVLRRANEILLDMEDQARTMLRLSLDPESKGRDLLLRQGRVIGWLEEALAPLTPELGHDGVHRLAVAIRSATGIESFVWLVDIARLSRADASATMRWTARSLLAAARRGSTPPKPAGRPG